MIRKVLLTESVSPMSPNSSESASSSALSNLYYRERDRERVGEEWMIKCKRGRGRGKNTALAGVIGKGVWSNTGCSCK